MSGWHSLCMEGKRWLRPGTERDGMGPAAEHTRRAPPMKQTIKNTKAAPRRGKAARGRPPRSEQTWQDDLSFDQGFADVEMSAMEREFSMAAGTDGASADDALTVYLKQMGSIPLLKPAQERDLTQRLESARRRHSHAGARPPDGAARTAA